MEDNVINAYIIFIKYGLVLYLKSQYWKHTYLNIFKILCNL